MDEKETKRVMTAGLLGLAVGDAVGVPVEFLDQKTVQNLHVTDYITYPARMGRSYPAGSWSDDTAMTVAAMDAVVKDGGRIDYSHIMQNFLIWWSGRDMEIEDGQVFAKYSSRELPFGLGCICGEAMDRFAEGMPVSQEALQLFSMERRQFRRAGCAACAGEGIWRNLQGCLRRRFLKGECDHVMLRVIRLLVPMILQISWKEAAGMIY